MPVSDDQTGLENSSRTVCGDRQNSGRRRCHRCSQMNDNAKWAMVCVRSNSMYVRHLDERQQRQEGETQKSGRTKSK
jgi:hypothetical protein